MASKMNKKLATGSIELPECQVCLETMTIPIYLCQTGHSLCNNCTKKLSPAICPVCRQTMTQMRNLSLEDVIASAMLTCPNAPAGCIVKKNSLQMEDHFKECIFRDIDCPLGAVFGRCSWTGKLMNMADHFKDRHPTNCTVSCDKDVDLFNVSVREDERYVYLVPQGKMLFLLTFKIDTIQKMAYWAVQHIGSKAVAGQHIYEIHVVSNYDSRRKVVFTDHCFNDAIKVDDVFRLGKCGVLPLESLVHFLKDKKLTFRFFIKRLPNAPKSGDGKNGSNGPNQGPSQGPNQGPSQGPNQGPSQGPNSGPKGPTSNGSGKGPNGPKGPNPKKKNNKA